jgi:hypothetical protein
LVHDLFSEPRYLWQVQPRAGAIAGLKDLARLGTVHIATTRLPKARRTTIEWLSNHGFSEHDLHFLKHGEKHSSLRKFTAVVEDDYAQGVSFVSKALTPCILIRHPWNKAEPQAEGLHWADTWPEVVEALAALVAAH